MINLNPMIFKKNALRSIFAVLAVIVAALSLFLWSKFQNYRHGDDTEWDKKPTEVIEIGETATTTGYSCQCIYESENDEQKAQCDLYMQECSEKHKIIDVYPDAKL